MFVKSFLSLGMFQVWKREAPLDRNLLLCEAAGGEIHQVNAAVIVGRQHAFHCNLLNECVCAAPCWGCPSSSSPPEEPSLWSWRRTGETRPVKLLFGASAGAAAQSADVSSLVALICVFAKSANSLVLACVLVVQIFDCQWIFFFSYLSQELLFMSSLIIYSKQTPPVVCHWPSCLSGTSAGRQSTEASRRWARLCLEGTH